MTRERECERCGGLPSESLHLIDWEPAGYYPADCSCDCHRGHPMTRERVEQAIEPRHGHATHYNESCFECVRLALAESEKDLADSREETRLALQARDNWREASDEKAHRLSENEKEQERLREALERIANGTPGLESRIIARQALSPDSQEKREE